MGGKDTNKDTNKDTRGPQWTNPNRITYYNNILSQNKFQLYNMNMINNKGGDNPYNISDINGLREKYQHWFIYGDTDKDLQKLIEINEILAWEAINYINIYTVYDEIHRLDINKPRVDALINKYPKLKGKESQLLSFTIDSFDKSYYDAIKNAKEQDFYDSITMSNTIKEGEEKPEFMDDLKRPDDKDKQKGGFARTIRASKGRQGQRVTNRKNIRRTIRRR